MSFTMLTEVTRSPTRSPLTKSTPTKSTPTKSTPNRSTSYRFMTVSWKLCISVMPHYLSHGLQWGKLEIWYESWSHGKTPAAGTLASCYCPHWQQFRSSIGYTSFQLSQAYWNVSPVQHCFLRNHRRQSPPPDSTSGTLPQVPPNQTPSARDTSCRVGWKRTLGPNTSFHSQGWGERREIEANRPWKSNGLPWTFPRPFSGSVH